MKALTDLIKNACSDYVFRLQKNDSGRRSAGIYFVVDKDDNIIYVGQSVDIGKRLSQHKSGKFQNGEKFLWKKRDESIFDTRLEEEAFWISVLRPVYNRTIKTKINPRRLMEYEES